MGHRELAAPPAFAKKRPNDLWPVGWWNRVVSAAAKRMTPAQSANRQPRALEQTVLDHRVAGVIGARREIPAGSCEERRGEQLVEPQEGEHEPDGQRWPERRDLSDRPQVRTSVDRRTPQFEGP